MFEPAFHQNQSDRDSALWFIIRDGLLLVKKNCRPAAVPRGSQLEDLLPLCDHVQLLGHLDGRACFAAGPPEDFQPTADKQDERAKICQQCGLVNYPRVSPAIIVAVIKDDQILLARSGRFPGGFFSVLAGFVEPGESLEACVKREVFEETGIAVQNIRYFGSQPWPFPDSLMVGFTAEYAGGDIQIDGREIVAADWYSRDNLPNIPPGISIARQLIDWFAEKVR